MAVSEDTGCMRRGDRGRCCGSVPGDGPVGDRVCRDDVELRSGRCRRCCCCCGCIAETKGGGNAATGDTGDTGDTHTDPGDSAVADCGDSGEQSPGVWKGGTDSAAAGSCVSALEEGL